MRWKRRALPPHRHPPSRRPALDVTIGASLFGLRGPAAMRLRQIEVFRAVMLVGTVSEAARMLNVSQPVVTRVLQHTELQLGFRLFDRTRAACSPPRRRSSCSAKSSGCTRRSSACGACRPICVTRAPGACAWRQRPAWPQASSRLPCGVSRSAIPIRWCACSRITRPRSCRGCSHRTSTSVLPLRRPCIRPSAPRRSRRVASSCRAARLGGRQDGRPRAA